MKKNRMKFLIIEFLLLLLAVFFVWKIFDQNVAEPRIAVILPESGDKRWDALIKGMKQYDVFSIFDDRWGLCTTGLIFGLISDFMMKACDYKNAKREVLIHGVFSMWVIGAFIPIVVTRDAYYQSLLPGYGQEYADTLMAYMPDWILPVLLIAAFVSGLVGGLIGRKIFKKHFERAGIV